MSGLVELIAIAKEIPESQLEEAIEMMRKAIIKKDNVPALRFGK